MAKKKRPRPQTGVPLTRQRLIDGLPGPAGTRIRLARPEESSRVGELLKLATDEIEQAHLDGLTAGTCGEWLLNGIAGGERDLLELLVRAGVTGRLQDAALSLSLLLVAQDKDGELVGALLALPPGQVVRTVREAGYQQHGLLVMLKYTKIKAVAVTEESRGSGVGAALLKRCSQLYWQLGYMLLFGEFEIERALGSYYSRQGYTVLRPGETTDIGVVLTGRPIGLGAGPGEQLFYRWNKS